MPDEGVSVPSADAPVDGGAEAGSLGASGSGAWATSGSRLRVVWWRTEDGAQQFAGFFDRQRGEECSFRRVDGRLVCLSSSFTTRAAPHAYADAECRTPANVVRVGSCGTRPKYVLDMTGSSSVLRHTGPPVAPGSAYERDATGACVPSSQDLLGVGRAIPLEELVAARTLVEAHTSRLSWVAHVGEDGSRERVSAFDPELGAACIPRTAADGLVRCLPLHVRLVDQDTFVDPSCSTMRVQCSSVDCAPTPPDTTSYALRSDYEASEARFSVFGVARVSSANAPSYRRQLDSACVVHGTAHAGVTSEVPPGAFSPLGLTWEGTPTRLRRKIAEAASSDGAAGEAYWLSTAFRDTALDTDCSFEPTSDGHRCLPQATVLFRAYLDEACKVPASREPPDGVRWVVFPRTAPGGCHALPRVHEVTRRLILPSPTRYWQLVHEGDFDHDSPVCRLREAPEGIRLMELGPDITQQLALARKVID